MKTRVKKGRATVRLVEVTQPGMLVVRGDEVGDVRDAYVKVAPTVRASERYTIDVKAVRERLIGAGAIAVVVAPVVLPDAVEESPQTERAEEHRSPEQHLRDWFAGVKGAGAELIDQALAQALTSVGEAGL